VHAGRWTAKEPVCVERRVEKEMICSPSGAVGQQIKKHQTCCDEFLSL